MIKDDHTISYNAVMPTLLTKTNGCHSISELDALYVRSLTNNSAVITADFLVCTHSRQEAKASPLSRNPSGHRLHSRNAFTLHFLTIRLVFH